jgi:hypothetical protein
MESRICLPRDNLPMPTTTNPYTPTAARLSSSVMASGCTAALAAGIGMSQRGGSPVGASCPTKPAGSGVGNSRSRRPIRGVGGTPGQAIRGPWLRCASLSIVVPTGSGPSSIRLARCWVSFPGLQRTLSHSLQIASVMRPCSSSIAPTPHRRRFCRLGHQRRGQNYPWPRTWPPTCKPSLSPRPLRALVRRSLRIILLCAAATIARTKRHFL